MACFTKTQQCNDTNCEFERYVTTSNFFVLNSLAKSHLNSVCTEYVCDKSDNAWVCAKWQWKALDWYYWIALPASPVMQSSNTVVSLSFHTHPCVLTIKPTQEFEFIGMHFRTQDFTMAPPPKMRTKVQADVDHWRLVATVSALVYRVLGTIQYMVPLVPRGRLIFRPIQWWPMGGHFRMGPDIRKLGPIYSRTKLGHPSLGLVGFPGSLPSVVAQGQRYGLNPVYGCVSILMGSATWGLQHQHHIQ